MENNIACIPEYANTIIAILDNKEQASLLRKSILSPRGNRINSAYKNPPQKWRFDLFTSRN